MAQVVHAYGHGVLARETRDGELVFRFDAAPRRATSAPQIVRKNARVLAAALPLHLLACAVAREPKPEGGWAQEFMPALAAPSACLPTLAARSTARAHAKLLLVATQPDRCSTCIAAWCCCFTF